MGGRRIVFLTIFYCIDFSFLDLQSLFILSLNRAILVLSLSLPRIYHALYVKGSSIHLGLLSGYDHLIQLLNREATELYPCGMLRSHVLK